MIRFVFFIILLVGCTGTSDYFTKFKISGEVVANGQNYLSIKVDDISMDDTKRKSQRIILDDKLDAAKNFTIEKAYFWGSSKFNAYKNASIKVSISRDGCKTWRKTFLIHKYYTQEKIVNIDLGSITLQCESEN